MLSHNRSLRFVQALVVLASVASTAVAQDARVRAFHASPDAPNVDVLVNDVVTIVNLPYGEITDYLTVPAGTYNFKVVPTGASEPVVIDADVTLQSGTDTTVAATKVLAEIEPLVITDDNLLDGSRARLKFAHVSPNAPPVDIAIAGGQVLFGNVSFQEVSEYRFGAPGVYDLEVRLAGTDTVVLALPDVEVTANAVYTVFAVGLVESTPPLDARAFLDQGCIVDFDFNGIVDVQDIIAYALAFDRGETRADFDGNGLINREDFFAFLLKWDVSDEDCNCRDQ